MGRKFLMPRRNVRENREFLGLLLREMEPLIQKAKKQLLKQSLSPPQSYEVKLFFKGEEVEFIDPDKRDIGKIISEGEKLIKNGLNFWKNPYLNTPKIKFEVPKSVKKILKTKLHSFENDPRVLIFPVESYYTKSDVEVIALYPEGHKKIKFSADLCYHGEERKDIYVDDEGKLRGIRWPILWVIENMDINKIAYLETAPIEVLHSQIGPWTRQYTIKTYKNLPEKQRPRSFEPLKQMLTKLYLKCAGIEELLVHGIGKAWFISYSERENLGFSREEIFTATWNHPVVRKIAGIVLNEGPKRVIEQYCANPKDFTAKFYNT